MGELYQELEVTFFIICDLTFNYIAQYKYEKAVVFTTENESINHNNYDKVKTIKVDVRKR